MPEHIHLAVEACFQKAEAFFKTSFPRPEVSFKLRGQKAGVAHITENKLRFNPVLYAQNRDDFLQQTVPHEVAHLVAYKQFGLKIAPHGQEWQLIMRGIYGLEPKRCHDYAITPRASKQYQYVCKCPTANEFALSARRHGLILKGRGYICKRCKAVLVAA